MQWSEDSRDVVCQNFMLKTGWMGKSMMIFPQAKSKIYGVKERSFKPHNDQGWWSNFFDVIFNSGIVASYYTVCESAIYEGD